MPARCRARSTGPSREVTGERAFELYGAGRTDAGVHALGQVAHLDVRTSLPPDTLAGRINDLLPADIHVLGATKVPHRFHARHDALSRTYVYQIARRRTAFAKPFVWWVKDDLRVGAMRESARVLHGPPGLSRLHRRRPRGEVDAGRGGLVELIEDADALLLVVEGSHFLWKMVRRMTGVLVEVGRGGLEPRDVARLLASPSGLPAQLTAPASGLVSRARGLSGRSAVSGAAAAGSTGRLTAGGRATIAR